MEATVGEDGVQGGVGMGMEFVVQIPPLDNAYPNAGSTGPSRAVVASAQLPASGMVTALLPHVSCSSTASTQVTVQSESGNYCSQSPPSRRASVMPIQILVYEALISCLKDACDPGIPGRSPRDAQLRTTLDGYLLSMASDNVVSGIVQSVEYLKTLLELSVELGLANDNKLRMALHKDGERIAALLMSIFASKSLEEAVLRLEGDSAQCFLDVVQSTTINIVSL
ncbi:hypothetical protein MSAN_00328100 [Mycena sanguinolenta]|uniref:Uncharacterized protein n=1 Tax=Mycena sanguinolenta TaxID=230812 RepID=A0A8H7DHF1_9AGAR|nr:hypothetical protein MSAN_00328100 [Mycena sanguinolenta]